MRILVTGATGFIGRRLVHHLVQKNIPVTILVREIYSSERPLPPPLNDLRPQLEVVYADLRNYQLTAKAVQQAAPTCVIHLAAGGVTEPFLSVETALRHNLNGTLNLARACFESKQVTTPPEQLIVGRTPGEQSAMNVYAASKAAAWQFCRMYSRTQQWPIQGAMIFQAYGPGQPEHTLIPAAVRAAVAGDDFPMTSGQQERDWVYVDDIVNGLAAAFGKAIPPGTTFDLGTGQAAPVIEVVEKIFSLTNSSGRLLTGVLPERPGEERTQIADASATCRLTGWQAKISLEQGLRRLLEQWPR